MEGPNRRYVNKVVVDYFKMQVLKDAIYGILGPNGSGKPTTIRLICALLTPDEGRGVVLGHDSAKDAGLMKRDGVDAVLLTPV